MFSSATSESNPPPPHGRGSGQCDTKQWPACDQTGRAERPLQALTQTGGAVELGPLLTNQQWKHKREPSTTCGFPCPWTQGVPCVSEKVEMQNDKSLKMVQIAWRIVCGRSSSEGHTTAAGKKQYSGRGSKNMGSVLGLKKQPWIERPGLALCNHSLTLGWDGVVWQRLFEA